MKHLNAMLILFAMVTVVLLITLGLIGGATFGQVLTAAITITIVAYVIGDLIVLPVTNTWIGLAVDGAAIWAVLRLVVPDLAMGTALWTSIVGIAFGGYFYHIYLYRNVIDARVPHPG